MERLQAVVAGSLSFLQAIPTGIRQLVCCSSRGVPGGFPGGAGGGLALARSALLAGEPGGGAADSTAAAPVADAGGRRQGNEVRRLRRVMRDGAVINIEYCSNGEDADRFDKAFHNVNIKELVALLSSTQAIDSLEEPSHPWAERPRTVGSLSAMFLACLAAEEHGQVESGIKDEVRCAGGIPPLVALLRSGERDRVQTAVVALRYLTDECVASAAAAYEEGVMPPLITCLSSDIGGMRGAAADALRNIYLCSEAYREDFVQLGGLEALVTHLDSPCTAAGSNGSSSCAPLLRDEDVQCEAVLNLEDLIEDHQGHLIKAWAQRAVACGAVERLSKLQDSQDPELRDNAQKVLGKLAEVM